MGCHYSLRGLLSPLTRGFGHGAGWVGGREVQRFHSIKHEQGGEGVFALLTGEGHRGAVQLGRVQERKLSNVLITSESLDDDSS